MFICVYEHGYNYINTSYGFLTNARYISSKHAYIVDFMRAIESSYNVDSSRYQFFCPTPSSLGERAHYFWRNRNSFRQNSKRWPNIQSPAYSEMKIMKIECFRALRCL